MRRIAAFLLLLLAAAPVSAQKISTVGRKFHAPLVPDFLQTSVLGSDVSAAHNHADTTHGTPTYSSTGMELDGSTDATEFPSTGVFDSLLITIAGRFTPNFATSADATYRLWSAGATNYTVIKQNNAASNVLQIRMGNTVIENIAEAAYTGAWVVDSENTIIVTGDDTGDLTSVYLNGTTILDGDTTAWANGASETFAIGSVHDTPSQFFDGEIRDVMVYDRIWAAAERAQFDASTNGIHARHQLSSLTAGVVLDLQMNTTWQQPGGLSDRSVHHTHATIVGAPVVGSFGVDFDGASDWLSIPDSDLHSFGDAVTDQPFSACAWVNKDVTGIFPIFDKSSSTTNNEWLLNFTGANDVRFIMHDADDNNSIGRQTPNTFDDTDRWYHVCGTYSAATQTSDDINVYVDGVDVDDAPSQAGVYVAMHNTTAPLLVGKRFTGSTVEANGEIAEAEIWERELSASEILLKSQQRIGGDHKLSPLTVDLTAWFPLTPDFLQPGDLPSDRSGAGNHATVDDGTATFSSTGYECDGSTDGLQFPGAGVFGSVASTIAMKFIPDFPTSEDVQRILFDTSSADRYVIFKRNNAASNTLQIRAGGSIIADIPEATYTGAWLQDQENTLIVVLDDTGNLTDAYLNETQILTADTTPWSNRDPATLYVCQAFNNTTFFDGEILDIRIAKRLWDSVDRFLYRFSNGDF